MSSIAAQPSSQPTSPIRKVLSGLTKTAVGIAILGALMFVSAGTLDWPMAWVYLAFVLVDGLVISLALDPDLMRERSRITADIKQWDKLLATLIIRVNPLIAYVLPGLDRRWHWSPGLPMWLEIAGAVLMAISMAGMTWAMLANRFFTAYVRIQQDRGQMVITTGPYRWVRHPGYTSGILMYLATPFMLGSLWMLIPEVLTILVIIIRTRLEDRTLHAELPGYQDYAARTRYRLLPGVW